MTLLPNRMRREVWDRSQGLAAGHFGDHTPTVNQTPACLSQPTPLANMVARQLAKRLPAIIGTARTYATATRLFPDEPSGPKVVTSAVPGTTPLCDGPEAAGSASCRSEQNLTALLILCRPQESGWER